MIIMIDAKKHTEQVLKWREEYAKRRSCGTSIADSLTYICSLGAYTPMAIRIVKDVEKISIDAATQHVFSSSAFSGDKEWWVKFWKDTDKMLNEDNN